MFNETAYLSDSEMDAALAQAAIAKARMDAAVARWRALRETDV